MNSCMFSNRGLTKFLLYGMLLFYILTTWTTPGFAITWGNEDTENIYSNVGVLIVSVPETGVFPVCSGTLIHESVVLSAGHCTSSLEPLLDADEIEVYVCFDFDPYTEGARWIKVEAISTHPEYNDFRPRSNIHDVGVLILEEPVMDISPAVLPNEGFLDELRDENKLRQGSKGAKLIVVGYGGALEWPPPVIIYDSRRRFAESEYQTLLKSWLRLSQKQATGDGGTCYGDSGGPAFWTEPNGIQILVGITSWGDAVCVASGFNYRVDIQETLDFISSVIQ
ncbi:MAG: trypsin-like serine protease [Thermodesulfobacteriota bacterium]|nr:trypsin-like serine protease [Thermodesulfobacteriota bacterium]